ncbi:hypothetical protein GCM10017562_21390 [Streptomyces roseofulvus]|uniref:hypothetical protein n=1 Tax=Streptomyces roseofulvus TaxID=33902 RepID=UPI0031F91346
MVTPDDIGHLVEDNWGRVGILRDVIDDYEDPARFQRPYPRRVPTAFLRPEGGGREWLAPPDTVTRV